MRRILLVAPGIGLMIALLGLPVADAATVTRNDRRNDAPAAIDIVRAQYTNADRSVSQYVRVRNLKATSNIYVFIGLPGRVNKYVARLWTANGHVHKRLMYQTVEGPGQTVDCRLRGQWHPAKDTAAMTVPWRCLDLREGRLSLSAGALRDQDLRDPQPFDEAPAAVVAKG